MNVNHFGEVRAPFNRTRRIRKLVTKIQFFLWVPMNLFLLRVCGARETEDCIIALCLCEVKWNTLEIQVKVGRVGVARRTVGGLLQW